MKFAFQCLVIGEFQAMDGCLALVVILFACSFQEVVVTHQERQIKALNQHLVNKDTTLLCRNVPTSTTPNHHMNAVSEASNGNPCSAYRPTTPGNSPGGVGHTKSSEEDKYIKAKVVVQGRPDVDYSFAEGCKIDLRPTEPGHSPGAGRAAHQNKNNGDVGHVQNQLAT